MLLSGWEAALLLDGEFTRREHGEGRPMVQGGASRMSAGVGLLALLFVLPAAAQTPTNAPPTPTEVTNARPALTTSLWSKAGVTVAAVRLDGVTFSPNDPILKELQQKAGEPLAPEKVRADLRRLFASGRYRDIEVSSEPNGSGITLIYAGVARYYVGRVQIDGIKQERLASLLEYATQLEPGTIFKNEAIPAALAAVKDSLAQNGYYQPVVNVKTTVDDAGHQINATFTISEGPQAHVGQVAIDGKDAGIALETFRKEGHLNCSLLANTFNRNCRPKVTRETTSNALSGVRSYYQKKDHLEGTISKQKETYVQTRTQLDYEFAANQGPVVKVVVNGVKLSKSRIKLLVPVYEEGAVDRDLLNEGAYNIKDYLQQQGYFDAQDSVQYLGRGTNNVTVQFNVTLGKRHKVTAVKIAGNKYFDTDLIEERLRVKKADAYNHSGRYSLQLVNADVDSILALYRANGFKDAKVTSSVADIDKSAKGEMLKTAQIRVTFKIEEGAQQKFGTVGLNGTEAARQKDVHSLLNSQTGQPFSLITLSQDRDAVLSYYVSHGFDHAKVEIQQNTDPKDATRTNVAINVVEGEQVFVDHVLLSGIVHTRPQVVQKELRVHAGDPLDQSALLTTQRNLYNQALFNEVNAAVQNPTGDAPSKNVLVQISEAKRWDVTYGFGFEAQTGTPGTVPGTTRGQTAAQNGQGGVSPRVTLDVSRINLYGSTQSLTLHTTYGLLERVATLTYNMPQLFSNPRLNASISGGYSNVQNITTFQASTIQGDFRIAQKIKRADNIIYDFQYRRISVDPNSLEVTPNLIPQLSEPVTVGGPQITFFHDTRDPTPLDAQRGQYFSVQEFLSDAAFGAQSNFSRTDFSHSSYYSFGKRRKYTFARNTRIGFEFPFGALSDSAASSLGISNCAGILSVTNATCNPIPLPERLYAGGENSLRGFGINSAGPRDLTTGYPVGGSAVVVNSFELRLPPPVLPVVGDNISFVLFHDMGNVFRYPADMFKSIKNFRQPNQSSCYNVSVPAGVTDTSTLTGTCSFNNYSHSVGLGARYKTPVGPIRVDFSWNLNPPVYPVYDDYTTNPPYVGKANHFNFFFGIGQSF
jgi:outer membrane protein assembly complex protein YaeT